MSDFVKATDMMGTLPSNVRMKLSEELNTQYRMIMILVGDRNPEYMNFARRLDANLSFCKRVGMIGTTTCELLRNKFFDELNRRCEKWSCVESLH